MSMTRSGHIPFRVGGEVLETFYKVFGDIGATDAIPVVALHGGPGMSHDNLLPITDLTSLYGVPIIFYDQVGCGASTRLREKPIEFFTIDLFVDELENLLAYFGITESFDLIGHSWGAALAAEFIIRRQPKGLRRLVLQNGLASAELRNAAVTRLRSQLPDDVQKVLKDSEARGDTKSTEYKEASMVYYRRHACRVQPFPKEVAYALQLVKEDPTVLNAMRTGPAQLDSGWDITSSIHLMKHVPTLLINGDYDFMTDEVCAPFYWGIDKVKWVKFANSSHMPHWEERERYVGVVGKYLTSTFP